MDVIEFKPPAVAHVVKSTCGACGKTEEGQTIHPMRTSDAVSPRWKIVRVSIENWNGETQPPPKYAEALVCEDCARNFANLTGAKAR